jgi:hypothetical protein
VSTTPERCPTCLTEVPEGAPRCPGCGRVFGEENRCPHCHAIAAVIQRGSGTVCAACGKPRAGTVVLGGGRGAVVASSRAGRTASTAAMVARGRGRVQRAFGVLSLGGAILAAVLAAIVLPGAFGIATAIALATLGVAIGALSLRAGARSLGRADDEEHRAREAAVLELAEKSNGVLTATQVAKAHGLTLDEADRALTRLVGDGTRVDVEVDGEGVVRYVFREMRASRMPPQVRVADESPEEAEAEAGAPSSERQRAR